MNKIKSELSLQVINKMKEYINWLIISNDYQSSSNTSDLRDELNSIFKEDEKGDIKYLNNYTIDKLVDLYADFKDIIGGIEKYEC